MPLLPNGKLQIRNKRTGEVKIIEPTEIGNYGVSQQSYLKELQAQQEVQRIQSGVGDKSEAEKKRELSKSDADRVISQLENMYYGKADTTLDDLAKGRAGGLISGLSAILGFNQPVSTYNATRDSSKAQIARALGEVGNLNEAEQEAAIKLLPKATATPAEALAGFKAIREKLGLAQSETIPSSPSTFMQRLKDNPTANKLAQVGANATQDAGDIVQGVKQLPGAFAEAGKRPGIGSLELLMGMLSGAANQYKNIATNPIGEVTQNPLDTLLAVLPLAQGAKAKLATAATSPTAAPIESLQSIAPRPSVPNPIAALGEDIRGSVRGFERNVKGTPFYSNNLDNLNKVANDLKLSGSAKNQLGQVNKVFNDLDSQITTKLQKTKAVVNKADVKQAMESYIIENSNLDVTDPAIIKEVDRITNQLTKNKLNAMDIYKSKKQLGKQLSSTFEKNDKMGVSITPKEEAGILAYKSFKQMIDTLEPGVSSLTEKQAALFDISNSLSKGVNRVPFSLGPLRPDLPGLARPTQAAVDYIGQLLQSVSNMGK